MSYIFNMLIGDTITILHHRTIPSLIWRESKRKMGDDPYRAWAWSELIPLLSHSLAVEHHGCT
jgi:hypothetical protein